MAKTSCAMCGQAELTTGETVAELRVGPRRFSSVVAARLCPACGESYVGAASLLDLHHQAARWVAEHGPASGDELRFLRKTTGLRAVDLARLLGVSEATISHWETGKHGFDRATGATLASLALDKVDGRETTIARLNRALEPASELDVRLSLAG